MTVTPAVTPTNGESAGSSSAAHSGKNQHRRDCQQVDSQDEIPPTSAADRSALPARRESQSAAAESAMGLAAGLNWSLPLTHRIPPVFENGLVLAFETQRFSRIFSDNAQPHPARDSRITRDRAIADPCAPGRRRSGAE